MVDLSPSGWRSVTYPDGTIPDPVDDHQTGIAEGDLVGGTINGTDYSCFYMAFDAGDPASLTDGTLAFRARVAGDSGSDGHDGFLAVGFDTDLDGAVEIFTGVNSQGNRSEIGIYHAGTGLNTSPSTTTITDAVSTYTQTGSNFRWEAVSSDNDPAQTTATANGGTPSTALSEEANTILSGYFISFSLPFQDLVDELDAIGYSLDESTPISLVMATARQSNAFNQDICGPLGGIGSSSTWDELGAISSPQPLNPSYGAHAPEPGALLMLSVAGGLLACRRRQRN